MQLFLEFSEAYSLLQGLHWLIMVCLYSESTSCVQTKAKNLFVGEPRWFGTVDAQAVVPTSRITMGMPASISFTLRGLPPTIEIFLSCFLVDSAVGNQYSFRSHDSTKRSRDTPHPNAPLMTATNYGFSISRAVFHLIGLASRLS